jgi:hypothetical protein
MLSTAFASVSRPQRERGLRGGSGPAHNSGSRGKRTLRTRHELGQLVEPCGMYVFSKEVGRTPVCEAAERVNVCAREAPEGHTHG